MLRDSVVISNVEERFPWLLRSLTEASEFHAPDVSKALTEQMANSATVEFSTTEYEDAICVPYCASQDALGEMVFQSVREGESELAQEMLAVKDSLDASLYVLLS